MRYNQDELALLQGMEGKYIKKVIYHYWVNKTDSVDPLHFIDYMEINFEDQSKIVLHRPDGEERITPLPNINLKELHQEVLTQFKGKIGYVSKDYTQDEVWKDLLGKKINAVLLDEDEPGIYTTEALVLETDDTKVLIGLSMQEGLEAGLFGVEEETND